MIFHKKPFHRYSDGFKILFEVSSQACSATVKVRLYVIIDDQRKHHIILSNTNISLYYQTPIFQTVNCSSSGLEGRRKRMGL